MNDPRMNRKQRRAATKQVPRTGAADSVSRLLAEAQHYEQQRNLDDAARAYRRVLSLKPDLAQAHNNLASILLTQGKSGEASLHFARALTLLPQLLDQYRNICATVVAVLPEFGEALQRIGASWPSRLSAEQIFTDGLEAIAGDPLLLCLLQSIPVRDVGFERVFTALRAALLARAASGQLPSETELAFACALAKQCFINEYVFTVTPEEDAQLARLVETLLSSPAPFTLAIVAMYQPLHALASAATLLERKWPPAVDDVVTQQLREPSQEHELRTAIPHLTSIDDDVSQRVREQYEENPYPRWVYAASGVTSGSIDDYLRELAPTAAFTPLSKTEDVEILESGCGTGRHAIWVAQRFSGARLLAVDLSLGSLAFAKRKTPADIASRIEYAQGDILRLGSLGRSFDIVDASGVLHHMADPLEGWRILLTLLLPGGYMHVGLYSELGRRDVIEARRFIAERGYKPTPQDIRRCRQDIIETPLRGLARFDDYFTMSECRDLLFHVQESRTTIPAIKSFIAAQGLKFIGFEFDLPSLQHFRALFAGNGWSLTDLDRWHEIETKYPDTFSGMYHFWLQKP